MKPLNLNFLGRGSAFNYTEDNTSAYLVINKHLYLFDCGEKIASKIIYFGLLNDIDKVSVFVTHLHSDHIGSLEGLLTYINVFLKEVEINVIYPDKDALMSLLQLLNYSFDLDVYDNYEDENLKCEIIKQEHVERSYGYFIYSEYCNFFYSGDTSTIKEEVIDKLKTGEIDYVYHDVSFNQSSFHIGLSTLENAFDINLRKKVYLMHFESEELINTAKENGFNVVIVK